MVSVGFGDPDHTRFRTVLLSVDASVDHFAIGCLEGSIEWPPGPGEFHRLTIVQP